MATLRRGYAVVPPWLFDMNHAIPNEIETAMREGHMQLFYHDELHNTRLLPDNTFQDIEGNNRLENIYMRTTPVFVPQHVLQRLPPSDAYVEVDERYMRTANPNPPTFFIYKYDPVINAYIYVFASYCYTEFDDDFNRTIDWDHPLVIFNSDDANPPEDFEPGMRFFIRRGVYINNTPSSLQHLVKEKVLQLYPDVTFDSRGFPLFPATTTKVTYV